ncbi:uncharacterized protein BDW43DRAFT_317378 [Aspergillus alliaceus]|uniref:uncharacterized protein n=1 Tax=Petromyces alliaceus TaxID=209559 RepID=UPI0012A47341|nr:uncharacterized protein BDW43DRAFT_317378 [Aspergillus alliaceus]KAB8226859.1 hypothetical protein BDW43DRAFT_317378 [Aspergillus alliaceus]
MTATGKLDRRHLRGLAMNSSPDDMALYRLSNASTRTPSTRMELDLQALWSQVLQVDTALISVNAHFFRLGGDSIAAMKLVTVSRYNGISLTVTDIFRNPFLCDLAALAASHHSNSGHELLVPSSSFKDSTDPIFAFSKAEISPLVQYPPEDILQILPLVTAQSLYRLLSAQVTRNLRQRAITHAHEVRLANTAASDHSESTESESDLTQPSGTISQAESSEQSEESDPPGRSDTDAPSAPENSGSDSDANLEIPDREAVQQSSASDTDTRPEQQMSMSLFSSPKKRRSTRLQKEPIKRRKTTGPREIPQPTPEQRPKTRAGWTPRRKA